MQTTIHLTDLIKELHAPEGGATFEAARARHPALVNHDSPDSVLAALASKSSKSNQEKDSITRALVIEYQGSGHALWATILIAAYIPMLVRLCGRIRLNEADRNERLQLVVASFLEAVISISIQRSWFCLSLRRETERRVFQYLGRERRQRRVIGSIESLDPQQHEAAQKRVWDGDPLWPFLPPESQGLALEPDEREMAISFLVEHAGHALSDQDLALVITTCVRGERLTDYVRHHYPDLDEVAQRREYERLKRRHSRAMAKLRELLAEHWEELNALKAEAEAWPWPRSVAASR